ncbi:MAG TPA: DUF5671 domain-containing protein [Candidatus Paceibacterota bacterium]|nr:DUF5671 domain-containing protein [Candidatus Paceibacterota bacterium]
MNGNQSVARDVFLYLLVIVVLTMSAVALGSMLFDFVNYYLPDIAQPLCSYSSCFGAIRTELAFLLVAFAVLVWAWRFLQRDLAAHPEKADLKVRRWLLYLTLFVAGVTVIGDLVALINGWLQGELTVQFLLKVLAVLFIAGSVFYYFLRELHQERHGRQKYVAWLDIVVVVAALVVGFLTVGSPVSARARNLDDRRVNDLSYIQSQIVNVYWTSKGKLPDDLDQLRDPVSGFVPPTDPESEKSYEYTKVGVLEFTLCATFSTASSGTNAAYPSTPYAVGPGQTGAWDHAAGRVCFDRTIDPQLYPIRKQ